MTYCQNQWISDYTYEGLMDYFQTRFGPGIVDPRDNNPTDRLLAVGTIDPAANHVELLPMFILPNAGEIKTRSPGDYAIVFLDAAGTVLANYPFTPDKITESELLAISEMVPYVDGTTEVNIKKLGEILENVLAGAAEPTVTITAPGGVEKTEGDTIKVSWTASDPDNDPLLFHLEYSPDNGETWQPLAVNLTSMSVNIHISNIIKGAEGRFRVWVSDGIHTSSDVSDEPFTNVKSKTGQVPERFVLNQNYPNPFNPETIINYELPQNAQVDLTIFNLLGQKVRVLVNTDLPAGAHSARWNGTDVDGNKVTSGVYIYRLKSGDFVETKKMIFLQ